MNNTLKKIINTLSIISVLTIHINANEVSNFLRGEIARLNHVFMDNNCTTAPRTLNEAIKGVFNGK